MKRNCCQLVWV